MIKNNRIIFLGAKIDGPNKPKIRLFIPFSRDCFTLVFFLVLQDII